MVNDDHVKWLRREGVKAWNELRRRNNFTPDFRGADLSSADLSSADLSSADLSSADLSSANLRKANLTDAILVDANLRDANLRRAILLRSEPWRAFLDPYRDNTQGDVKTKISSICCLLEICQNLRKKYDRYKPGQFRFYFRGETQVGWNLSPSIVRPTKLKRDGTQSDERDRISLRSSEEKMLVDLMSRQPETFQNLKSALAQWVLAQHHGLKTRLLDVTRNPLVALFNACEKINACEKKDAKDGRLHLFVVPRDLIKPFSSDAISVVANFAKLRYDEQESILGKTEIVDPNNPEKRDRATRRIYSEGRGRLHHFICQEKPYFRDRIDPRDLFRVFVVEPQQSFGRIRAQAGAFLISAFHDRFERNKVLEKCNIPIYDYYKLSVCGKEKSDIRKDLRLLNITRETLYPGLDEAAEAITECHAASLKETDTP